jgi:hypothetical protein
MLLAVKGVAASFDALPVGTELLAFVGTCIDLEKSTVIPVTKDWSLSIPHGGAGAIADVMRKSAQTSVAAVSGDSTFLEKGFGSLDRFLIFRIVLSYGTWLGVGM